MKIIFLDIDGVICNRENWKSRVDFEGETFCELDKEAVALLNQLVEKTDAKIVVSSSWRGGSEETFTSLMFFLRSQGVVADILDMTPRLSGLDSQRGDEIKMWLEKHSSMVDALVVLDDDNDMRGVETHHVWTLTRVDTEEMLKEGLTQVHVDKAIEILDKPAKP